MVVAIMLAAGEGTRCYPFTHLSPKIAQGICGIPLIEYMLSWFGGTKEIEKLFIVVKHDETAKKLKNYVENRKDYISKIVELFAKLGYEVNYVNTDFEIDMIRANGWETGGDLRYALRHITENVDLGKEFLVCNGDYVIIRKLSDGKLCLQMDLDDILKYHREARQSIGTVVTDSLFPVARQDGGRFGIAEVQSVKGFNVITKFVEKPDITTIQPSVKHLPVNAGVYVMDRNFIFTNINELLPDKPNTKLEKTILERLATETERNMSRPKLAAYMLNLFGWFDVGTLEQLIDVSMYVANKKGGYIPPPVASNNGGG